METPTAVRQGTCAEPQEVEQALAPAPSGWWLMVAAHWVVGWAHPRPFPRTASSAAQVAKSDRGSSQPEVSIRAVALASPEELGTPNRWSGLCWSSGVLQAGVVAARPRMNP